MAKYKFNDNGMLTITDDSGGTGQAFPDKIAKLALTVFVLTAIVLTFIYLVYYSDLPDGSFPAGNEKSPASTLAEKFDLSDSMEDLIDRVSPKPDFYDGLLHSLGEKAEQLPNALFNTIENFFND